MKKSGYVFFGIVLLFLLLPVWTGWIYPQIQHQLHTQNEQVQRIHELVDEYMAESYPDRDADILRIKYSHHPRHYYVEMLECESGNEFYILIPEKLNEIDIDQLSDNYPN